MLTILISYYLPSSTIIKAFRKLLAAATILKILFMPFAYISSLSPKKLFSKLKKYPMKVFIFIYSKPLANI